jgi:hypothetical protein
MDIDHFVILSRPVERDIRRLPVPVQCAIEWLGTAPEAERTWARLKALLDHFEATYAWSEDHFGFYLRSATAIAQRRYRIPAEVFAAPAGFECRGACGGCHGDAR